MYVIMKKLPSVKNCPMGEISPNLVTLLAAQQARGQSFLKLQGDRTSRTLSHFLRGQGDPMGRIFAHWAIV
jgi:hypothetical protein